ncbi:LAMI_0E16336g1_1 [Lachancea mirantina]|uniref:LAMI_0E16336g1_1 n=1 Tax=Lachancea mirantina TaxID=1230905 RepID=A0A1G4JTA9_9SACH|nr:LAMI_0E16336g1_1 [Lachancea mirantina]
MVTTTIQKPIPVTILSGFLGSGKTTLLEKILTNEHGMKVAVIINDMSELNIDAALIENHKVCNKEEKLIQLSNGCICCTLRGDLLEELVYLAEQKTFNYIVIESTGIAEPMQVAETFSTEFSEMMYDNPQEVSPEEAQLLEKILNYGGLNKLVKIDTCVTVIDALNFFSNVETTKFLVDRWGDSGQGESDRTITDLMIDQVEFADVIIINKSSTVKKKQLKKIKKVVNTLNPVAQVITSDFCKVPLDRVVNTGLFDFEKASTSAGWLRSINEMTVRDFAGNTRRTLAPKPETEEYGVNSFVYRRRKPFHPKRLYEMMRQHFYIIEQVEMGGDMDDEVEDDDEEDGTDKAEIKKDREQNEEEQEEDEDEGSGDDDDSETDDDDEEIEEELSEDQILINKKNSPFGPLLRSKGFFWLATRYIFRGEWSSAGPTLTVKGGLPWFDVSGFDEIPEETVALIKKDFEGKYGDRRNEIVFIGLKINVKALSEQLDSCLLTDEEFEEFEKNANTKNILKANKDLSVLFEDGFEEWGVAEMLEVEEPAKQ